MPFNSTSDFVNLLRKEGELIEIREPVDPYLELAEIQRQTVSEKGKALLFTNVKGSSFPVATNLYGSEKRIDLAFSKRPQEFIRDAVHFAEKFFPPTLEKIWSARKFAKPFLGMGTKRVSTGPILQGRRITPLQLPQIQCWPEDGGAFVTLPLVYTQSPSLGKSNLGMYRVQIFDEKTCGMHIQIHRGGGFHFFEAEQKKQNLPVHVFVGGPPALTLAAILPLPEDVPEILFASILNQGKIRLTQNDISPYPILADADFCIVGDIVAGQRKPEGPFGDHYGYYSLRHDYPFVNVKTVLTRPGAIYPATVVGRPPQEDHYLACYLQELLKPLIRLVMPQVMDVWAYEESGVHSVAGAIVKDRYPREALTTALRILGEGQLSLSKVLLVTDQNVDVKDFRKFLRTVLERLDFSRDVFILSQISQDTLDYTGPKINEGSKMIGLGVGEKIRDLPENFSETLPPEFSDARVFCPGALVISGPAFRENDGVPQKLSQLSVLQNWPLVVLLDDAKAACASNEDFLWHVFTRFEPARDVYSREQKLERYHVAMTLPLVIDARLKPWYPKVLTPLPTNVEKASDILARAKKLLR